MRCEKCGRFTFFKKLCDICAREQQAIQALQAGVRLAPFPAIPAASKGMKIQTHVHGNLKLRLKDHEFNFDLGQGMTDEMLDEIGGKLNMSRDQVRNFLQPALSPDRIAGLTKSAFEIKTQTFSTAPPSASLAASAAAAPYVLCHACNQQAPAGSFCSHCGAALPS